MSNIVPIAGPCGDDRDYVAIQGPQGPQGQRGEQGIPGVVGPQGPQGVTGAQGPAGPCGPQGERGPRGERGEQGPAGRDGVDGKPGPMGPEGPRGCNGKDGRIAFEELEPHHIEMLRGETGPMGPEGPKGEKGDQGIAGPRGLQGPQGPAGPNGTQGPKGDPGERGPMGATGPRGEKGETGERGGLNHDDGISESTTWNSKTIAEFVLHGKSKFTERVVNREGIRHTVKGLVKDLVVHGNTVTNFINQETYRDKILTTGKTEKNLNQQTTHGRLIYQKPEDGGPGLIVQPQRETRYSVIFKLETTRGAVSSDFGDKAKVTTVYVDGSNESVRGDLDQGLNEVAFPVKADKELDKVYLAIEIQDPSPEVEEDPHPVDPAFTMSNFMILAGDYSQQVTPRYFWGTRGVGDKISEGASGPSRKLILESRNKNLINPKENLADKWIGEQQIIAGVKKPIWSDGQDEKNVTFLIYCRQADYVLTLKPKHNMIKHLRAKVVGFTDIPSNGQPADETYLDLTEQQIQQKPKGIIQHKFHTGATVNVIGLYVGNLAETAEEQTGPTHKQWTIADIFDELQLEEGETATHYEPYKCSTKEMIIPRQINAGETLKWDDAKGVYYIYDSQGREAEKTEILEESFIPSYDDMTYLYVKNKIPSLVTAKFPVSVDDEQSYKIADWGFEGADSEHGEELSNFIKFPNGVFMQWREIVTTIDPNRSDTGKVTFYNAKKIIYASATSASLKGGQQGRYSRVNAEIDPIDPHTVNLHLDDGYGGGAQEVNVTVFIISDNRPNIIPVSEE